MLGRQQNGYVLNGLSILLPRDFVPYKSQTSMSIVPCGATMDKGIEGKVFTMQQRNYSRDLYLVEKDTVMNAHVQAIREEKEDIGFYARVPRIVRTGYKELSHAEKWLYTCLRDLCGEAGECWRSLRALAKETGISIASLSSMIPHLAQVGLIDAMKKSTWFIKIKNIWQANKEYCSKNEHSASGCSENEQGVQKMNTDCSENEQGCSNFVTKEDISKKIESEEDNTKKDISSTGVDDAIARKYKEGLLPRNSPLTEWLQDISLLDDAFLAEMEQLLDRNQPAKLSTPVIPIVDTESHIATMPTRKEAAPPPEQPHLITTKAALQAVSATSDGDLDQSTSPPTRETKAKGKRKKVMEAQPAGPPQKPPDDMAWSTRKCLAWFTYWRGKPLIGTYKNSQASTCAKGLAENYTEAEVIGARNDMELDAYYVTRGGADICDVANNIHKYLKRRAASSKTQGGYIINGKHYKQLPYDYCEWQGKIMLKEQANDLGWNGGFERYK